MSNDQTLVSSQETADGQADSAGAPAQSFKFVEPMSRSLLMALGLGALMVLVYGLTFGVQAVAEQIHSPSLQAFADFIFYGGMMTDEMCIRDRCARCSPA